MAVYRVYVLSEGGADIIDHADTIEMGGGGYTDSASRELAESYARTGVAQALRQGYRNPYATVNGPYGEVVRVTADDDRQGAGNPEYDGYPHRPY